MRSFLRRLLRLIRETFAPRPEPPGVAELVSDWATLYRGECREPGVAASWWICHHYAQHDLSITLVNLARLKEESARCDRSIGTAEQFRAYLDELGLDPYQISHLVLISLRAPSYHSQRRVGKASGDRLIMRPVGVWPCDLQGFSNAWAAGDRYANRIIEVIARNALKLKSEPGHKWEDVVQETDWLLWLETCAQRALGEAHVLQPRRVTRESRPQSL